MESGHNKKLKIFAVWASRDYCYHKLKCGIDVKVVKFLTLTVSNHGMKTE